MLKGSSRPRKNTRPLMTRTRRLQGPAHDGTAGLDLREDLSLELVDPGRRVEPRVGQQARFHASLGQEFGPSQPYSTATWGSRRPRYGPCATLNPSTPGVTCFARSFDFFTSMSWGGVKMLTSTVTRSSSSAANRGNRGSSAAPSAPFSIDLTRGKNGCG